MVKCPDENSNECNEDELPDDDCDDNMDTEEIGCGNENSIEPEECEDDINGASDGEIDCNELSIEAVKHRPVLWDFISKDLSPDRTATNKKRLWKEVYEAVKGHLPNFTDVKNRWRNLTTTFNENFKAANSKQVSGMEGQPPKEVKWKYYKLMSFLSKSNLSHNSFTESSMDSDSRTTNNDDCESEDGSIQAAERIGQREFNVDKLSS
ncbi:hypothetical protein QAD02_003809 [Eretmocerus hayati]|uniref:Uncharacterized protein n=1 Tax=Eretmocerus hayati TaxID=131215 RepID=A0ACC2NMP8_9HYME|nr:hypothetical protein QAD02_003809 [Eretmocerus hayati]